MRDGVLVGMDGEHGHGGFLANGVLVGMDAVGVGLPEGVGLVGGEDPVDVADAEDGHLDDGEHLEDGALVRRLNVVHVVVGKGGADLGLVADEALRVVDRECESPDSGRDCEATKAELDSAMEVPLDWEPVEEALDCFGEMGTPSFNEASVYLRFSNCKRNQTN